MDDRQYTVRASHCDHRASEEEIYEVLKRTTDPLERSWKKLEKARRIVLKFNMIKPPERIEYFAGRRRELVDDAVARAVLRLLRERTTAELIATDTYPYGNGHVTPDDFNYRYILDDFGVRYVDSNLPPFATYDVPGGGCMFDRYLLNAIFAEADEVVSIAKMKNHAFMGITLTLKNLFGLPPMIPPEGRTRSYYHHLIRLSYVLPDLGMITKPCLNIVEALTGQWGREWGGEGRICNALMAGDHPVATDACGMTLMGHDPHSDWPTPPFRRDRNHLLIAAEHGFGTVDLNEIDFVSEVEAPLAEFDSVSTDSDATVANWRRTTCEQGLIYQDEQRELIDRYRGEFIYMQDGQVVWNGIDPSNLGSRRKLSGDRKDSALWLKYVDPAEGEGERFERYNECLRLAS
ncbi:MAG: DUF362 domain-containing protein [Gemmatimonadetes bacterium]|nr:DUF362 domain-containing protein [Gemmatimonadota bacterium]MXY81676.1 DUF362 domain-containing protein [Gemmatimonadota bacterium]MYB67160.1 DUF362 domain-containing protein [Gemmatimonadota bacterium]